jgi:hypothetical protein
MAKNFLILTASDKSKYEKGAAVQSWMRKIRGINRLLQGAFSAKILCLLRIQ